MVKSMVNIAKIVEITFSSLSMARITSKFSIIFFYYNCGAICCQSGQFIIYTILLLFAYYLL